MFKRFETIPKPIMNLPRTHPEFIPNPLETSENKICNFQSEYSEARLTWFASAGHQKFKISKRSKPKRLKFQNVWIFWKRSEFRNVLSFKRFEFWIVLKPVPNSSRICPEPIPTSSGNHLKRPKMIYAPSKTSIPRQG